MGTFNARLEAKMSDFCKSESRGASCKMVERIQNWPNLAPNGYAMPICNRVFGYGPFSTVLAVLWNSVFIMSKNWKQTHYLKAKRFLFFLPTLQFSLTSDSAFSFLHVIMKPCKTNKIRWPQGLYPPSGRGVTDWNLANHVVESAPEAIRSSLFSPSCVGFCRGILIWCEWWLLSFK